MPEPTETYQWQPSKPALVLVNETRAEHYDYMIDDESAGEAQLHFSDHGVEIWGFEIYPRYKRLGHGSRMYRMLEKRLLLGTTIWLWVHDHNLAGVQFWLDQGFCHNIQTNRGYRMCKTTKTT